MDKENSLVSFLSKYWSIMLWIVTAIFAAGGLYAEFSAMEARVEVIEKRLDKKIQTLNTIEGRIIELEKREAYLEGYTDAINR